MADRPDITTRTCSSSDEDIQHELDYSHSEMESFELTFSNFSRRDGAKIGRISLAQNRLRVVPRKISVFSNLNYLDISGNLIEFLSPEISKLTHLRVLIAKNNRLTAAGLPADLDQLTELQHLNLSGNPLGKIPEPVLGMDGLVSLYVGSCGIHKISKQIKNLTKLEVLYLGGNSLTEIPGEVGSLENLQTLHLNDNCLELLSSTVANLTQLCTLSLHKNRLATLPSEIIKLENLKELSLRDNPLMRHFVRHLVFQPASLKEIAARFIKIKSIRYAEIVPMNIVNYLSSAHHCVNSSCRGVYFDSRFENIKFVDFCGKYKVPILEYLCSPRCLPTSADVCALCVAPSEQEASMMKKVLLG